MAEAFRSLASIFAQSGVATAPPPDHAPAAVTAYTAPPAPASAGAAHAAVRADARVSDLLDAFVADLARLRARAAERLEESAESLLADLASRVLARELVTSPAEVTRLIADAARDFPAGTHLLVHVCESDALRLGDRWPVAVDSSLQPGDFALELDDGRYEASLQTRLEALLASHRFAL